ncbi:uncharacterized protein LOC114322461 isoform X1 [Camellia sinensis]|uniref:uncharacterized protein LOC114322461 isoform X1 n=1 Tax=Camellia sinensis TaxID=4442 RepID=UPI001035D75F|nr:uncharacterized protein LOC114322461 isoform X1 [Camellia sinensis]
MAMALISLTWETQKQRGVQLFLQWAIMQGVAMLLQNRYQRQRLCTHIALGKARRMDVVWGETAGVDGQLWLLAPILFILQLKVGNGEDCIPRNGRWNFNKQLFTPIRIERWEVVNFSAHCDTSHLSRELINCGRNKGLIGNGGKQFGLHQNI